MPHKSMRSLIEHYYRIKMNNHRMIGISDIEKNSAKDNEDAPEDEFLEDITMEICDNCRARSVLHQINGEMQCISCKKFFEYVTITPNFNIEQFFIVSILYFFQRIQLQPTGRSSFTEANLKIWSWSLRHGIINEEDPIDTQNKGSVLWTLWKGENVR